MRRRLSAAAVLLCACAGTRVAVRDPAGRPIAGAAIIGDAASYSVGMKADERGEARVPWTPQPVWWVRAERDGYCPSYPVDVRGKPERITVVLSPSAAGCKTLLEVLDGPAVDR